MSRWISFITAFLFFLWILPLGTFIKPSREKTACGGQRAICLCSHWLDKTLAKGFGHILVKGNSSPEKEGYSPAGSSHYDLISDLDFRNPFKTPGVSADYSSLYTCQFLKRIEHVPKV